MAGGTAVVHAVACTAALLLSAFITEGSNVVVLVQGEGGDGAGYFPLAEALSSVTRLAVEHLDEAAAAAAAAPGGSGSVTLWTEAVDEGVRAVADLCLALDRDEDTVAVRKKGRVVSKCARPGQPLFNEPSRRRQLPLVHPQSD